MTASPERGPVISGKGVRKQFRRENQEVVAALDDVSIEVGHGALTALVGPDGAGKTTLIRLVAGLMVPDGGSLQVLDIDVVRDPQAVQDRTGYMPQKFGLYEDLSVQENLDLYADLHGVSAEARRETYPRLMEMTALAPVHQAACRTPVRRHEAEARPRLHAGALARSPASRRADGRRRPAVAARALGNHPPPRRTRKA